VFEHGVSKDEDAATASASASASTSTSDAGAVPSSKKGILTRRWNRTYLRVVVTKLDNNDEEEEERVPVQTSEPDYRLTAKDLEKNLAVLGIHPVHRTEPNAI
jgi:hypothetical protein